MDKDLVNVYFISPRETARTQSTAEWYPYRASEEGQSLSHTTPKSSCTRWNYA